MCIHIYMYTYITIAAVSLGGHHTASLKKSHEVWAQSIFGYRVEKQTHHPYLAGLFPQKRPATHCNTLQHITDWQSRPTALILPRKRATDCWALFAKNDLQDEGDEPASM